MGDSPSLAAEVIPSFPASYVTEANKSAYERKKAPITMKAIFLSPPPSAPGDGSGAFSDALAASSTARTEVEIFLAMRRKRLAGTNAARAVRAEPRQTDPGFFVI